MPRARGKVVGVQIPRFKHRWFGVLEIELRSGKRVKLLMSGTIAQWFMNDDRIELEADEIKDQLSFNEYRLWKFYEGDRIPVWPPYSERIEHPRLSPLTGEPLYKYEILAREACYESDFEAIAELEQFHYASEKELVAIWRCEDCGYILESNIRIRCPNCGSENVRILEIKGSTPASRFLILEYLNREEYEPRILGYVRVDPPVPLMHRRLPSGEVQKNIREQVFPEDWFKPVFSPEFLMKEKLRELLRKHKKPRIAMRALWEEIKWEALAKSNTACSRIARVVIHPDYRSDGLGQIAVKQAVRWIEERRVPEMRKRKHLVEVVAMMARYNPFFEKVGFRYLWDTGSGRPVLYYPLTDEARDYMERFLREDPIAREHGGRLFRPSYGKVDMISSPLIVRGVSKSFSSTLDVEGLDDEIKRLLEAFGARRRVIQRVILRNINLKIKPGEVVAVVGASGAGKTTLLKLIVGLVEPDDGEIVLPENARISAMIPGELEPDLSNGTIIENIAERTGDIQMAVEILNKCGLSDAILYRARFNELSTGQKERAKLAALLAERPNLLIIDELAAHLDVLTAMRVVRKISQLAREAGITLIAVTHRKEVVDALDPDKILYVGYGTVVSEERGARNEGGS